MADPSSLTLNYDFTDPQFDGVQTITAQTGADLTVTRAADATVMDYFNVLKTVNDNEPRFTGGRRVENEAKYSETIAASWNLAENVTAVDAASSINGVSLSEITDDATSGEHSARQINSQTGTTGREVTFSLYCKAGTSNGGTANRYVGFGFANVHTTTDCFDMQTGAWVDTGTYSNHTVEDLGSGFYRISATILIGGSGGGDDILIAMSNATTVPAAYSGSGDTIFVGGVQLEDVTGQDDPAPSEYIATTTAAKAQWYATKRRTNLCLQSDDLNGTGWTDNVSGSGSVVHNGDGSVTCTSAASLDRMFVWQSFSLWAGETYTLSATITSNSDGWDRNNFHISSPAVGQVVTGNGRSSYTFTANTDSSITVRVGIGCNAGEAGQTSGSITIADVQLERGSTATAYIATTDAVASSDFDTAITPTGLLIEEARTNNATWTESFDSWTGTLNATIAADDAVAPDGTSTADKITDDATNGPHGVYNSLTFTAATASVSCYFKAGTHDFVALRWSISLERFAVQVFDLSDGTVGQSDVGATEGSTDNATCESVGNGWYRCSFSCEEMIAGAEYISVYLVPAKTGNTFDGTGLCDYVGTGTTVWAWGADVQTGSFPTSYIPNDSATASVTRAADVVSTTDVSWYDSTGGSFYWHGSVSGDTAKKQLFELYSGAADRMNMAAEVTHLDLQLFSYTTTGNDGAITTGTPNFVGGVASRAVGAFALNDEIIYLDGSLCGTELTATLPITNAPTTLKVGVAYNNTIPINGHIARIVYYNERLADSVLEDLSNGTFPVAASVAGTSSRTGPGLGFGLLGKMGA